MNSVTICDPKDNEAVIRELGIKQKHLKRKEEKAWLVQQNKCKRARKQIIRERNFEKEVRSKALLNCRNKDTDKYNEKEKEKDSECRVGEAPWPRVTWKGLGMEPFLKVPGKWRDNMVWPRGEIRPPYRNGSEPVIWIGEEDLF